MNTDKHVTILGLGNILMGDEGFGVHFVRRLEERYTFPEDIEVVDGGTLGYMLLDVLSRSRMVIVIDVMKLDDEPGSIYRFSLEEFSLRMPPPTTAHEVKFPDVLCKAEMMDELPDMLFFCTVPQSYSDLELEMTPVLQKRLDDMERLVLAELETMGITPQRLAHA